MTDDQFVIESYQHLEVRPGQSDLGRFLFRGQRCKIAMARRPASLSASVTGKPRKWAETSRRSVTVRGYGWQWEKTRKRILSRDRHLCQECQRNDRVTLATDVDHITPKSQGGGDEDSNLQALCTPCHRTKTAREGNARKGG